MKVIRTISSTIYQGDCKSCGARIEMSPQEYLDAMNYYVEGNKHVYKHTEKCPACNDWLLLSNVTRTTLYSDGSEIEEDI